MKLSLDTAMNMSVDLKGNVIWHNYSITCSSNGAVIMKRKVVVVGNMKALFFFPCRMAQCKLIRNT